MGKYAKHRMVLRDPNGATHTLLLNRCLLAYTHHDGGLGYGGSHDSVAENSTLQYMLPN